MKRTETERMAVKVAVAVLLAVARAAAQERAEEPAPAPRRIVVSIPDCKLAVIEGERVLRTFEVAVGAPVSPSPRGTFTVVNRIPRPTYYHPGKVVGPGRNNPLGTRWIGLSVKGFGIHGTNVPRSIGKAASHGCVRLRNTEIEELFDLVRVGDIVELRGERDEVITALFGQPAAPATETPAE